MWKKWLFPSIVAIVIISLIVPYWVGMKAEHEFNHLNQTLPIVGEWHPVGANYQRGWFQSQAKNTFRPAQLDQQYVTLQHDIQHSVTPFQPTTIETTLETDADTQSFLQYIFAGRAPFLMKTEIYMTGGTSYLQVAPFSMRQDQQAFIWQGLQGQVNFDLEGKHWENKFVVPQFALETQYGKVQLEGMQLNGQAEQKQQLYLGQLQLQVDKIVAMGANQLPLQLNKIQVVANNDLVDEYLDFGFHAQAQALQIGQQQYQPQFIDAAIQHIHEPTLREWRAALQALNPQNSSPANWNFMQLSLLMKYGLPLLKHQPEMNIKQFHIQTHAGEIKGQLQLGVDEVQNASTPNMFNPLALLGQFQGSFSLTMPQEIADMVLPPQQKQWLLSKNLLTLAADEQQYQTELTLNAGTIDANGINLPLMQLIW